MRTSAGPDMNFVPMQSPAGHVLQNSQDAGDWHEASVSFIPIYAALFLPLPEYLSSAGLHYCNILMLGLGVHRYVFDGKPPALKKEELSRRWAFCMLLVSVRPKLHVYPEMLRRDSTKVNLRSLACCRVERRGDATDQLTEAKEVNSLHAQSVGHTGRPPLSL